MWFYSHILFSFVFKHLQGAADYSRSATIAEVNNGHTRDIR